MNPRVNSTKISPPPNVGGYWLDSARNISRRVGIDDCAPGRVTEIVAAATAKRIA